MVTWWLGKANKQVGEAAGRQGKGAGRKDDEMMRGCKGGKGGEGEEWGGCGGCLFAEKLRALYPKKP